MHKFNVGDRVRWNWAEGPSGSSKWADADNFDGTVVAIEEENAEFSGAYILAMDCGDAVGVERFGAHRGHCYMPESELELIPPRVQE